LGEVYKVTEMKMDRNFRAFIDFMSLELEVPTICLVTGGVSVRRDRRYVYLSCLNNTYSTVTWDSPLDITALEHNIRNSECIE
jgi:hypothetical protein